MARRFELEHLWDDDDFVIQKGVLDAKATLSGTELGPGVIYCQGTRKLKHRIADHLITGHVVLDEVGHNLTCAWNPGRRTKIVNLGSEPTDFFQVQLNYTPDLGSFSNTQLSAATANLLYGSWPRSFRESVKADLEAIGLLVSPYTASFTPVTASVRRAARAKEDLEFKLAWLAAASRRSRTVSYVTAYNFKMPWTSPSTGSGTVNVTANTKHRRKLTDVPGCEVWANAFGHGDDVSDAEPFSQLSTPTKKRLPVGKYTMWARCDARDGPSREIPSWEH